MTPYRELTVVPRGTPRSKFLTSWLRTLIRVRGRWRERFVRCAVCRKGVLPMNQVYGRGGSPGAEFIRDVLDHNLDFPCGHLIADHKKARGDAA